VTVGYAEHHCFIPAVRSLSSQAEFTVCSASLTLWQVSVTSAHNDASLNVTLSACFMLAPNTCDSHHMRITGCRCCVGCVPLATAGTLEP